MPMPMPMPLAMRLRPVRGLALAALAALALPATACIPDIVPDPSTLPQCEGLDSICGDSGEDDCCAADKVPGGTFNRINDGAFPASVTTFELDRYEVTVGRFRSFVLSYAYNKPPAGAGASAALGGPSGWDPAWDEALPEDQEALESSLECDPTYARWTSEPGANEDQPINCVSWYLAFAFCVWDGSRLPTETEWNYAAAAGNEQRNYPWGDGEPDDTLAVFDCPSDMMTCTIPGVGSRPAGKGKWGHMDLAGSMAEWTLDYFGVLPTGCDDDCAVLADEGNGRVLRGGDFTRPPADLLTTHRLGIAPADRMTFIGFRCARDD